MPFVQLNDQTQIHYIQKGQGSQKILFIHGHLANNIWWETTLDHLPPEYQGFALDLPGSGKSPETKKRHTMDYFAEVVFEFTEKLKITEFYLVGHSMGGIVSQLLTLNHPQKVLKLILLDSTAADGFHVLYNAGKERNIKLMKDKDFLKNAIQAIAPHCKDQEFIDRVTQAAFNASEQVFLEQPDTMHEVNCMSRMKEIKCPVLFLHGDEDDFVPKDGSERTAKAIPGCIFRYLKKCGHSPMAEVFDDYFKQIIEFIKK